MRDSKANSEKLWKLVSNPTYIYAKLQCGLLKELIDEAFAVYQNFSNAADLESMVRCLFREIMIFDLTNRPYGNLIEDVHNFIVFKKNNQLHADFFRCVNKS